MGEQSDHLDLLHRLCTLGRSADANAGCGTCEFDDLRPHDWLNRQHFRWWHQVTVGFSTGKMVDLLRGLTIAERGFRWTGCSVAAGIWIFRELVRRDPRVDADQLAEWVLQRTTNPYMPYGTRNGGAKTLREFAAVMESRAWEREDRRRRVEREQVAARQRRQERAAKAAERRQRQLEDAAARDEDLQRLLQLTPAERLLAIARDTRRPLTSYPPEFADVDDAVLAALTEDARRLLSERLQDRRRGPWKRLMSRLGEPPPDALGRRALQRGG